MGLMGRRFITVDRARDMRLTAKERLRKRKDVLVKEAGDFWSLAHGSENQAEEFPKLAVLSQPRSVEHWA